MSHHHHHSMHGGYPITSSSAELNHILSLSVNFKEWKEEYGISHKVKECRLISFKFVNPIICCKILLL
jgi:hypothetical protein